MRPLLMLLHFFFWAFLFCACDKPEIEFPGIFGIWILENVSQPNCFDPIGGPQTCDSQNCETLTFRHDHRWIRTKITNGVQESYYGTFTEVDPSTLRLCSEGFPCEGALYEVVWGEYYMLLRQEKSEISRCQTDQLFARKQITGMGDYSYLVWGPRSNKR